MSELDVRQSERLLAAHVMIVDLKRPKANVDQQAQGKEKSRAHHGIALACQIRFVVALLKLNVNISSRRRA